MKKTFINSSFNTRNKFCLFLAVVLLVGTSATFANPRDQAKRIHDRLAAVPPSEAVLTSMAAKIVGGDSIGAAMEAMDNPGFYNIFLKNYVTPWTNVAGTVFMPLNDYTATVIGIIRDDAPFTEILTTDVVYMGGGGLGLPAYSQTNNAHYAQLESSGVNLGNAANLVRTTQSGLPGAQINSTQAAGVLTTRAAGEAFLQAGTNRRMLQAIVETQLCTNLLDLNDPSRTPDRVRQDVTRSPGGDSTIFLNSCVGCHAGMDPLIQAFAYYEWAPGQDPGTGRVVYTDGAVQEKYLINATTFPGGYITQDDSWDNSYWRSGKNALLGWNGAASSGNGAQSMGQEFASSRAFSTCQVKKAFKQVCFREPANPVERAEVERIANNFEVGYKMKTVFAEVASFCKGK